LHRIADGGAGLRSGFRGSRLATGPVVRAEFRLTPLAPGLPGLPDDPPAATFRASFGSVHTDALRLDPSQSARSTALASKSVALPRTPVTSRTLRTPRSGTPIR